MLSLLLVPLGHHDNGKEKKLEMDGLRLLKLAAAPKTFSQKSKKHRKTEQKSRNYHPCVCVARRKLMTALRKEVET